MFIRLPRKFLFIGGGVERLAHRRGDRLPHALRGPQTEGIKTTSGRPILLEKFRAKRCGTAT